MAIFNSYVKLPEGSIYMYLYVFVCICEITHNMTLWYCDLFFAYIFAI